MPETETKNQPSKAEGDQGSSLKKKAIRGTAWTIFGYGASQVVRLGSNLILTRLLVPEYFGLMALINVLIVGLSLFSDIGIGPSIIQNDRGEDPEFLNTAWTIQVFRGFALWICACIAAWPFAMFYGEPELVKLIPVSGLTAVIAGFNSTGLFTANRRLKLGPLTLIELGSQIVTISVMLIWAWISPSVWALVAGSLVGTLLKMFASHIWLAELPNRLAWNQEAFKSLITFGRWIFISTILGFFVNYADRLVMGKFMTLSDLGVYSIASMMSKFIEQVYNKINQQVLFPFYSNIKHLSKKEFRQKIKKIRIVMISTMLPPLWIVVLFGQKIIDLLFDSRYQEAGWMLQILAAGFIILFSSAIGPFYLAYGNSFLFMNLLAIKSTIFLILMTVGAFLYGKVGLICGISLTNYFYYPIQVSVYRRFGLWIFKLDAIGMLSSAIVIGGGLWLMKGLA